MFWKEPFRMSWIFVSIAQQLLQGQGLLIIEASRSYSGTSQSVVLLWTSDQSDAERPLPDDDNNNNNNNNTHRKERFMLPVGFEPAIPASSRRPTL